MTTIRRRTLLRGAVAVATTASLGPPGVARAAAEPLVINSYGGAFEEDKASGTQLIQELITDGCHGVTRYQPTIDKIMRLHSRTAMIENGFVHIPEAAPWLDRAPLGGLGFIE